MKLVIDTSVAFKWVVEEMKSELDRPAEPVATAIAMQSVHIRTKLESEHLSLPELRPLIGKQVEITVRETAEVPSSGGVENGTPNHRYPLRGSVLRYDDPFAPAIATDEWEAAR